MYYSIDCYDVKTNSLNTNCAVWGDDTHLVSDSEWQQMKNGAEITTYDETGNEEFRYSIHED